MPDLYYDLSELQKILTEMSTPEGTPLTKSALNEAVLTWMQEKEAIPVLKCRDCNTYSTTGVQDGYGWCKKFCFGPEYDFFCLLAAPWEQESEPDSDKEPVNEA